MLLRPDVPVDQTIAPQVQHELRTKGFALVKLTIPSDPKALQANLLLVATLVGRHFSRCVTWATLEKDGAEDTLPVHTESIYGTSGICPYFALGCSIPARLGGETRIYDGRIAAQRLVSLAPGVAAARIRYTSLAYPQHNAEYPVVYSDQTYGAVLRYRQKVETNSYQLDRDAPDEETVYNVVDAVLRDSLILEHRWEQGDLVFVNNNFTLHDRLPFTGKRSLVRLRFDDPITTELTY